ncbi:serine/threonine-protein kinase [Pseudozyma hubeiensis SY62]|uniref:Serine/threonine-protein kinase n=1 Tax=Pseudozyma hubeiensis (strain SY62) TaxID=1305764 RepID=R9NZ91_PSEHS|nr:serine/threonine-protein kinase [Pseudozyma hubeiensis SY62]GAC94168.1 serine/threonine-protein kinase [Pseudozyma hubeiensis SY62]
MTVTRCYAKLHRDRVRSIAPLAVHAIGELVLPFDVPGSRAEVMSSWHVVDENWRKLHRPSLRATYTKNHILLLYRLSERKQKCASKSLAIRNATDAPCV